MYYQGTIRAIREAIREKHPSMEALFVDLSRLDEPHVPFAYLLWMCDEIEKMDITSIDQAIKAGRWIGWISAHVESKGLWKNDKTRDLVREDKENGFDKPRQK